MGRAAERQVLAGRESRDAARARLDTQIARIRGDMEQRGIKGRIADEASAKALAALDEAAQVASESKGVLGGTLVLLALWFFRRPVMAAFHKMLGENQISEGLDDDDHG